MKTVGITGSEEKVKWVKNDLGADACINYKTVDNLQEALAKECPNGIDVYFDNVGGHQLDACLALMNKYGRIIGCGAIDNYNGSPVPITNYMNIIGRSLDYHGFIVSNYVEQWGEGIAKLSEWLQAG
jgi:NADPH-dependent curcumin reductase CurA